MDKTALGDRMKLYEFQEAGRRLIPLLPAMARIDGRTFSSFTRGLERPYDKRLCDIMKETTIFLVKETCANFGYTQSDEITLVWHSQEYNSEIFFGGRIQKMVSQLAALATLKFNNLLRESPISAYADKYPTFDARVWNLPNQTEAVNALIWREQDAVRNSILSAGYTLYSHKELMYNSTKQVQEKLFSKGINWNDYPAFYKHGTYIQRYKTKDEQLNRDRTQIREIYLKSIVKLTNRNDVIFNGSDPQYLEEN